MNLSKTGFDDYLNPIFLKEIRKLIRSNGFIVFFVIYLVLIAAVPIYGLGKIGRISPIDVVEYTFAVLYFFSMVIVPYNLTNTMNKKGNETEELVSITTMPYSMYLRGYFLYGMVLITMLYFISVPFLFLALFMGSLELSKIFTVVLISYLMSLLAVLWQLDGAQEARNKSNLRVIIKFLAQVGLGVVWGWTTIVFNKCFEGKIFNDFSDVVICLIIQTIAGFVMYHMNVASEQSETSETPKKAITFRVYLTIVWGFLLLSCCIFRNAAEIIFAIILFFIFGNSVCIHNEPEGYSERFINEMPSNPLVKFIKFPFLRGLANGVVWLAIITITSCFAYTVISNIFQLKFHILRNYGVILFAITSTVNAYLFFGSFVRKLFFKKYNKGGNILIAIILFICIGCIPTSILARRDGVVLGDGSLLMRYHGPFEPMKYPFFVEWLNPIAPALHTEATTGTIFAAIFLLVFAILLNIKSLSKQFTDYSLEIPYEDENDESDTDSDSE